MVIVGLAYPLVSLFEPANMHVVDYLDNTVLFNSEAVLLSFVWIDLMLECIHRSSDSDRKFAEHYIFNAKLSTLLLVALAMLLDFFCFHANFPLLTYRFSRYLRPCKPDVALSD